jgi:N-acetylmuramoyl-L-alanine amidase
MGSGEAVEQAGRAQRRAGWSRALRAALALAALGGLGSAASAAAQESVRAPVVVVDAGHGGDEDLGAVGRVGGLLEKDVALAVANQIGRALSDVGMRVVYTRTRDRFVPLAERTSMANRERADFFLSVHANASSDPVASGLETYFLSVAASDEDAEQVALIENQVFQRAPSAEAAMDVGQILTSLAVSDHMRMSRRFALSLHNELRKLPGPSRGVKQADFVVLGGVNMPSALLELGFLTNEAEELRLGQRSHQQAIALAVVRALTPLLDEVIAARTAPAPGEPRRASTLDAAGMNEEKR